MMLKVARKKSKVFYDENRKIYIKSVALNLKTKLKCLLGLRKFPGHNFKYIAGLLNSAGINTPEILYFDRYTVEMREVEGRQLVDIINDVSVSDALIIMDQYIKIIAIMFSLKVYAHDAIMRNFIIDSNMKLHAIDLDGYHRRIIFNESKTIKRLIRKLKREIVDFDEFQNKLDLNFYDKLKSEMKLFKAGKSPRFG